MSTRPTAFSRRQFLKGTLAGAAAAAAPLVLPSRLFGETPPSRQIGVGLIGVGGMGQTHLDVLLGFPEVRVLAICDVDRFHREAAVAKVNAMYGNRDCRGYLDFRELNVRRDLDAVWVATPDHWHALAAIDAVRQRKDVYVEKPLTLTIHEGRALVQAARQFERVVQTGTQQRSTKRFRDTAQFIRNGGLGRLERIDILIPANNKHVAGTWTPDLVPEGLDWDRWLGPAPWVPFTRHGCHYNFRFIREYALGQVTNWGAHYIDIAQWALDEDNGGPERVEGQGEYPTTGLFSTATRVDFTCHYRSGVQLRCHTRFDGISDGNVRFFGERGWIDVSRGKSTASDPGLLTEVAAATGPVELPQSSNHHDNFLHCVRTRERPISDVETGHRTTTACILGELAMWLGRPLRWDATTESFRDDAQANRLRRQSMRAPWSLIV